MEKREVRQAYDRLAPWFDLLEGVPELLFGLRARRRRLLSRARGRVLEVAVGTGKNLPHYPRDVEVVGADLTAGMLAEAVTRGRELESSRADGTAGGRLRFVLADTEALPFPDASFDTVVDSLTLCTYPDPVGALQEMARVCRPSGRLLLLEHGRSSVGWLGRLQDRQSRWLSDSAGCHWNREPQQLVREAGMSLRWAERGVLGVFHLIEAPRPDWF